MAPVKRPARASAYSGPATPDRRLASMFAPRSKNAPATVNRICLLGGYDAAEPGLSTFVSAMRDALLADRPGMVVDIVRVGAEASATPGGGPEVVHRVGPDQADSRLAAQVMNSYDAAVIHYESAAYAHEEGGQVLEILEWITIPVVCVMHEVRLHASDRQRHIVDTLTSSADAVVVLSETGRQTLLDDYRVEPRKLMVIRHGGLPSAGESRSTSPVSGPTILTWGRLGPAKGIDLGIAALARLRGLQPAPRYVVAGPIDPAYRQNLLEQAESLGVADRVEIAAGYLDRPTLSALVDSADVVLLPYAEADATSSAVLAEAVGAKKPVVSTPFPHAVELLKDDRRGILVPYGDAAAMAAAIDRILTDPELRDTLAAPDATTPGTHTWALAASQYRQLINALFRRPSA